MTHNVFPTGQAGKRESSIHAKKLMNTWAKTQACLRAENDEAYECNCKNFDEFIVNMHDKRESLESFAEFCAEQEAETVKQAREKEKSWTDLRIFEEIEKNCFRNSPEDYHVKRPSHKLVEMKKYELIKSRFLKEGQR